MERVTALVDERDCLRAEIATTQREWRDLGLFFEDTSEFYTVKLKLSDIADREHEIEKWCKDNIWHQVHAVQGLFLRTYFFREKEKAALFKLFWG